MGWEIFNKVVREMGGWLVYSMTICLALFNIVCYFVVKNLILQWGEKFTSDEHVLDNSLITLDGICVGVFFLSQFLLCYVISMGMVFAGRKIHVKMTFKVLHCKVLDFLQRVPVGRIVNRFSADIDSVDRLIGPYLQSMNTYVLFTILNVYTMIA